MLDDMHSQGRAIVNQQLHEKRSIYIPRLYAEKFFDTRFEPWDKKKSEILHCARKSLKSCHFSPGILGLQPKKREISVPAWHVDPVHTLLLPQLAGLGSGAMAVAAKGLATGRILTERWSWSAIQIFGLDVEWVGFYIRFGLEFQSSPYFFLQCCHSVLWQDFSV